MRLDGGPWLGDWQPVSIQSMTVGTVVILAARMITSPVRIAARRSCVVGDVIWSCPVCEEDLEDYGDELYCPECERWFTPVQVHDGAEG